MVPCRKLLIPIGAALCLFGSSSLQAQTATKPAAATRTSQQALVAKPYLQLGQSPAPGTLVIAWHADDVGADWSLDSRTSSADGWRPAAKLEYRRIAVTDAAPHRLYRATLKELDPGAAFSYRIRRDGRDVFEAEARAPKAPDQSYRFAVLGDCGAGSPEEKQVAYQAYLAKPDYLMITGDIVYERGRVSEYRENFWPVYNADEASPEVGAPLLRSTLFTAAVGNHDVATRDLAKCPDGLAYFLYWDQPLNGPLAPEGSALVPLLAGPDDSKKAFTQSAGPNYPRMANFSFDYGDTHWTVLDSNPYVDWTNSELRAWVASDFASAQNKTWRFVAFHHPGFSSSREHYENQQMRRLADVLDAGKVDIVFSGHVHNYQRAFPLRFVAGPSDEEKTVLDKKGNPWPKDKLIPGHFTLDKTFNGRDQTRADGVIYLVTGAGGQHLYNPEQQDDPGSWQSFTAKFVSKVHSLTVVDVEGKTLKVRQISATGEELDRFQLTK
jgi:hypothetical protein